MSDERDVSKVVLHRQGVFGDYRLIGLLHENDRGDRAWHIKQISENPVKNYYVEDGKFFSLEIDPLFTEPILTRLERGDLILDMSEDERLAILDAIATWEKDLS